MHRTFACWPAKPWFAPALLLSLLAAGPAHATVRLPRLVSDHLVLQRDAPVPLWGWAAAGERVRVVFQGKTYPATLPDAAGRWAVTLPARPAGGPFDLTVIGTNTLTVRDVLLGDVWLASGQSNMEWPLRDSQNGAAEVAGASFPRIRLLAVPNRASFRPEDDFGGAGWQPCTPATVANFSAVAFLFGRALHQRYHVPIGLIAAEWGGTPAEAWTSATALRQFPEYAPTVAANAARTGSIAQLDAAYGAQLAAWQRSPASQDQGLRASQPTWADPTLLDADWATLQAPGLWESQVPALHDFNGIVWLRRDVELPPAAAGQPLALSLGQVDDQDSTFFNGVAVGATRGYNLPRRYVVPGNLVRAGRNVLAVRVVDTGGGGGLWGSPAALSATGPAGPVALAGPWRYRPAYDPASVPRPPFAEGAQMQPAVLFNGMVAPLRPVALRGVIWYQGESNADTFERAAQYGRLFPALIRDWRQQLRQPALPFLFVQLAGFQADSAQPADYPWARLRAAQAQTLALPRTGMAVALDVGNRDDIHPRDKQTVAARLVLAARRVAYGETMAAAGPALVSVAAEGPALRLRFGPAAGGLRLRSAPDLAGHAFALAGADRRFYWATARLEGDVLVLTAPEVPTPVAARYAWGNTPPALLFNAADLPAPPFRTDDWPAPAH